MDASLSSRCMTAILDGVTAGTLVNFDQVSIAIRQSIFANIQQVVHARTDDDLPAVLRRGQFFDNFEQIHLLNSIDCSKYFELLSTIATEIDRPESSLRSGLVSLRLKISYGNFKCSPTNRLSESSDTPCSMAVVCRLIAACRNLRRLDLYIHYNAYEDSEIDSSDEDSDPFRPITNAIRTESVVRAHLEQLTLRNFILRHFERDFSIFDSLRVLKLSMCNFLADDWLPLLKRCRLTLQSLTLEKCTFLNTFPDEYVELVALSSLNISTSNWYDDDRLLLSAETLGRVQDGRVCLLSRFDPATLERIRDSLSPKVEVAYGIERDSNFAGLSSAHQLFGQRLVELRISYVEEFPDPDEFDKVVSALKSIRVLMLDAGRFSGFGRLSGDEFLRRFLSDTDRCAKLRWLQIICDLQAETVRLVFRHCYNLEFLFLVQLGSYVGLPEITDDDLTVWAAKGAKPKEVYLGFDPKFTVTGVNRLLRNCGDDLKASFLDERRQFVKKNDKLIEDMIFDLSW